MLSYINVLLVHNNLLERRSINNRMAYKRIKPGELGAIFR